MNTFRIGLLSAFILLFSITTAFTQAKIIIDEMEVTGSKTFYVAVDQPLSFTVRYENTIGDDLSIETSPDPEDISLTVQFPNPPPSNANSPSWEETQDFTIDANDVRSIEYTYTWTPNVAFTQSEFFADFFTENNITEQGFQITILPATANASVPTLSEWGMVLLILLMLNLGLVTIRQAQIVPTNNTMTMPTGFHLPFQKTDFLIGLRQAAVIAMASIVFIFIGWGTFTPTDGFGLGLSTLLLAYLLHLKRMK